jgi:hypothetical protein
LRAVRSIIARKRIKTAPTVLRLSRVVKFIVLLLSASLLFSVAFSLSGCVETVTPQVQAQIAKSDPMTAAIADKAVHEYIHTTFKAPYSVRI